MNNEPKEMQEIHEIRKKLFQETRGMTDKEYITKIEIEALEFEKEMGKKFKRIEHARV